MHRRVAEIATIAAVLAVVLGIGAQPALAGNAFVATDARSGETVVWNGMGMAAPPPGETAGMVVDLVDGRTNTLEITTSKSGEVSIRTNADFARHKATVKDGKGKGLGRASTATGECSVGFYELLGSWAYLSGNVSIVSSTHNKPSNVLAVASHSNMTAAAGNVHATQNVCSLGDRMPYVANVSQSSTAVAAGYYNIVGGVETNQCRPTDGQNVMGWGGLAINGPNAALAIACIRSGERDTTYNIRVGWTGNPSSCSNHYVIEDIATHEWGHAVGLADVYDNGPNYPAVHYYPSQTMSSSVQCGTFSNTLGLGDVSGIDAIY